MYLVHPLHDGQCRCVITLDGRLDAARMARAVELSLRSAPVLECRYVPSRWQSWWERRPIPGKVILFTQVRPKEPDRELNSFLAEPLNPLLAPQVAVRLIRSSHDTLCLKLNHMAADAAGTLDYVRLLSDIYQQLRLDPGYTPPPAIDGGNRGHGQIFRRAGLKSMLRGCFHFRYPASPWGFPAVSSDLSGRTFTIRRINQDRMARLKVYCRTNQVKFNDVLVTAFYRGLIDTLTPPAGARLPVQLTIDLRRYLLSRRAETICDLTGVYYPMIRYDPQADFEQTLSMVRTAMAKARAGHPWLGEALLLELVNIFPAVFQTRLAEKVMQRELSAGKAHPFFANLGVIDPRIFEFGDAAAVDLAMFGPVTYPPNFLMSTYTFRETLVITSSFCDTAVDPLLVDRFFNSYLDELPG